jgi:putative membrane protein
MYNWVLWFHVLSFISWMAAIFYIPRQFVYHVEHKDNEGFVEVIKIMEYKLIKYIGYPSMWATILSGLFLIYFSDFELLKNGYWLWVKLFFATLLIIYFLSLEKFRQKLKDDKCNKSGKFFRAYNEVPTILMLFIVAMVVLKPF